MTDGYVKLSDVCAKASSNIAQKDLEGHTGAYPIYGASGYIADIDFYQQEDEYIAIVKDGAGVGRTMLLPAKSSVIGTLQYIIPDKKKVDIRYLFFAIVNMELGRYFSGATIPHIYFRDYQHEVFKLPDLVQQKKFADILQYIERLTEARKRQLSKLDDFVKSRFVEMFGDPVYNSKELPTKRGIDFFKLSNGKFVPESRRFESGIPAYGGNGISWYTDDAITQKDTLVVGRVGFQSGNVHFAKGPLWITDNAMYISDYNADKYDLIFLCALMQHIDFTRFQDAGDLKKITQKPFMNMEYILPTLSKQHEYVAFVAQTDKSKFDVQNFLRKGYVRCEI